jgi:hypothetical protein
MCIHETSEHLLTKCNFIEAVWNLVASNCRLPHYNLISNAGGPIRWVKFLLASGSKKKKGTRSECFLPFGGYSGKNVIAKSLKIGINQPQCWLGFV